MVPKRKEIALPGVEECRSGYDFWQLPHRFRLHGGVFPLLFRRNKTDYGLSLQYLCSCVSHPLPSRKPVFRNAPLFAFGIFFRNSYFVGLVKSLFAKKNFIDPIEDEGDFYFEQLTIQWKENYSK